MAVWENMKNALKITGFLLCLLLLAAGVLGILAPKGGSGIYDMKELYSLKNHSVDVLMLGSSLSFINIDPAVLWQQQGIAAYSLGGAMQPIWNSYYYLKEALRTQSPQLVTLEIFSASQEDNPNNYYVLNNVSAIRSPINRWGAVRCSATPDQYFPLFLGFPNYHGRYAELSKEDFLPCRGLKDFEYYLGHGTYFKTVACTRPDVTARGEPAVLPEKSQEYLLKIIVLCQKKGIPLLLFASPTAQYPNLEGYYQTVEQIARQSGVDFADFNLQYDAMGLDFETDFADENHLNQSGCPKFSAAFGEYLAANYELEDHRGDTAYQQWDNAEKFYEASLRDYQLAQAQTLQEHLEGIEQQAGDDLFDLVWVSEHCPEEMKSVLRQYNVPEESGLYRMESKTAVQLAADDTGFLFDWGADTYCCTQQGLLRGTELILSPGDCIAVVTFDRYTMKIADAALYDAQTGNLAGKPVPIVRSWVGTGD